MTTNAVSGLLITMTVEGALFGAATNYSLNITQDSIDVSSDDSDRWGEFIVGRRGWTIDVDALYIYTDAAQIYVEEHITAANPATSVSVVFTFPDGRTYSGEAIVTSISYTGPFESPITAAVSLQGTDALTTSTS